MLSPPAPPAANSARVAEAIVNPPSGQDNDAFKVINPAASVTISGLTIDMAGAVGYTGGGSVGQQFLSWQSAPASAILTLNNNILTGGDWATEGKLVFKSTSGNSAFVATNNRIFNGGFSNGWFINNASTNANLNLTITNNVWLDNAYLAANIGSGNGTTIIGNIKNNWIGNSTPGTSGVDNYDSRQAGFLFAGEAAGLQFTNNTFKDIEDVAIYFGYGYSGPMTISDNIIDGYSNVSGRAAVMTRTSDANGLNDVSQVTFTGNSITGPTVDSTAVLNDLSKNFGVLDARGNWWGTATPDFNTLVDLDNVNHPGAGNFSVLVDGWLTTDPNAQLAETGSEFTGQIIAISFGFLLAGGAILIFATRKRKQLNG